MDSAGVAIWGVPPPKERSDEFTMQPIELGDSVNADSDPSLAIWIGIKNPMAAPDFRHVIDM